MTRVLRDTVWVDGRRYDRGFTDEQVGEAARSIGDHAWTDASESPAVVGGVAVAGLKDTVYVDGVRYDKGAVPPPEVAAKIGDHLWVGERPASSQAEPPAPPAQIQRVPVQRSAPTIEVIEDVAPDAGETSPGTAAPAGDGGDADLDPPPTSGPGSGLADWLAYAERVGVEVPADAKRADVIEAVRAAGKPVE